MPLLELLQITNDAYTRFELLALLEAPGKHSTAIAMKPFSNPAVEAHFKSYPPAVRKRMLALRELVFRTAASTEGVGELQETLKWGEPAYVTAQTRSGSTVRMDWKHKHPEQYAMYFHCQTGLVERFRNRFPNDFAFDGNRALVFKLSDTIPTDALASCIETALTYHSRKRSPRQEANGTACRMPHLATRRMEMEKIS